MKKIITFLLVAVAFLGTISCDSHSGEIDEIKKTLLWDNKGKEGVWSMEYSYDFVDDIVLTAVETMTLNENGEFIEETVFYFDGNPLLKARMTGKWDVEYDGELDAYFFDQDYDDRIVTQNLNMKEEWFRRFDTTFRIFKRGDAYDALNDPDEDESNDVIYGNQIIDYNKNLFLVKNLGYDEIYRYEPVRTTSKITESVDYTSSIPDSEGDAPSEETYILNGKIGNYPIEMELTAFEGNINWARYRYTETGSGEWIDLDIESDDMGRTLMYESLNGERVGCLEGRLSIHGNSVDFSGWHKNFKTGKEITLYAEGNI